MRRRDIVRGSGETNTGAMAEGSGKYPRTWGWGGERTRVHLALLTVQIGYGGYYVLTKLAMSDGVNRFVFAAYRDCIGLLLLAPIAFFSERTLRPAHRLDVCLLIVALGVSGIYLQQTLFLAGLACTNSAFAAAMQNAIPVFTFLIAVVCRVEIIRVQRIDGMAKVAGIIACIAGAAMMSLYKGIILLGTAPLRDVPVPLSEAQDGLLTSAFLSYGIDKWQIGSLCLVGNCICMGVYTNLQIPTLRKFPAPVSLTALSIFVGTIALVITGLLTVQDSSQWVLTRPGTILSVAYAGAIASGLNFTLQTWANHRGGPVLVAAYIPLQAVLSAVLALLILDEPLYLGTVIGGILILIGLYLLIWGQRSHLHSQDLQAALPFSAVIGDVREPLLPRSTE